MIGTDATDGSLTRPWIREELMLSLGELEAEDPRPIWQQEVEAGLISGIDQVFHFFFDDHDFEGDDIGPVLFDKSEVAAIQRVKRALDAALVAVGDAGEDEFVQHPLWQNVRTAAEYARRLLSEPRLRPPPTTTADRSAQGR